MKSLDDTYQLYTSQNIQSLLSSERKFSGKGNAFQYLVLNLSLILHLLVVVVAVVLFLLLSFFLFASLSFSSFSSLSSSASASASVSAYAFAGSVAATLASPVFLRPHPPRLALGVVVIVIGLLSLVDGLKIIPTIYIN